MPEGFLTQLRRVNTERYFAWTEGADAGIMFDALELGGEVGELLNVVKKLDREQRGWRGSRADPADFADECADVLICLDKLARRLNVDLEAVTIAKFNTTSDKVGLPHLLAATPATNQAGEVESLQTRIAWAICRAATPDALRELREFGNASPIADAVIAALATQPATSQEGELQTNDSGLGNDWLGDQDRAGTPTPPANETDYKSAWAALSKPLSWMHDSARLKSYWGWNLADIANDLIDRAYPGLRPDKTVGTAEGQA